MILETKRLLLRYWREDDAEILYYYAKEPEVGPPAGWPPHASVEDSLGIIQNVLTPPENFAVELKETGEVVGCIGLMIGKNSHVTTQETEGEIGYWLGVPHWGNGYIPEAVMEVLRYSFEDLALEKIWCAYYDGNEKSHRVQEKCGFIYQYTEENVDCPLIHEVRTNHVSCITKEAWFENKK